MNIAEEKPNIPRHVGLIMDGNRRWAKERNLPTFDGHKRGYDKFKTIPEAFFSLGVEIVSVYAFSTENWNRAPEEVNYLMKLLKFALSDEFAHFHEKNIRLVISGRIDDLPGDLPDICRDAVVKTVGNTGGILNVCLNYGGRAEITDAFKKMLKNNIDPEQVHEGMVRKYLYQADLPDPDIIVRTSGEKRLSGFLLWECAYSELMFMEKHWPDFERLDAETVVNEYVKRNRRFGGN